MTDQSITFAVERIGPATAKRFLEQNIGNRKCSEPVVAKYAKAILAGEWLMNGETIKFDDQERLLDGQHRLRAVIRANTAVEMCVVRGLPGKAFKTLDQGKARKASDCLYILKYKNPHALAAAGRMMFAYERQWPGKTNSFRPVSNDELLETIKRHPGLVKSADAYMRKPFFTKLIPHSVGMLAFYLAGKVNSTLAAQFFVELAGGKYEADKPDYPPRVLRDQLTKTSLEYIKPNTTTKLAWVIQSWNAFAAKKPLARLSRIIEAVPRFFPDPVRPQWRD